MWLRPRPQQREHRDAYPMDGRSQNSEAVRGAVERMHDEPMAEGWSHGLVMPKGVEGDAATRHEPERSVLMRCPMATAEKKSGGCEEKEQKWRMRKGTRHARRADCTHIHMRDDETKGSSETMQEKRSMVSLLPEGKYPRKKD